ncbi:hypothetical protein ATO13_22616 [Stappia sp. 22II-S9-Z10]|nr:hypothetical protein ATO13_22616 [Stappia sp. 22II-S9-Z10]
MADSAGADRSTGAPLADWEHVKQSLGVLFTTPLGTRVMRRDFGSELPALIGETMTTGTILKLYVAAYMAVLREEPRFELTRIGINEATQQGRLGLDLEGRYRPTGHLDFQASEAITVPTFTIWI